MGRKLWFLLLVATLVTAGYLVGYTVQVINPAFASVAELKVRSMMAKNVNEAVREKFSEETDADELFQVTKDDSGKIAMVQTDTAAMNRLTSDLTWRIQKRISGMGDERVEIPVGTVLGSSVLSQIGPSVPLKIIPLSSAKVNYKSEFEAAGVNQTRHKIYLQVDCTAKILAPFTPREVELHSQILIAETVVVGDVPQSYIIVPKENVLDALD